MVYVNRVLQRRVAMRAALPALAIALVISGCGRGTPANAVVNIAGATPITRAAVDHWVRIAAGGSGAPVPDPPSYSACVNGLRASEGRASEGKAAPTVS